MQTTPITKVAIGIIAWNEEKALRATLDSIFKQTLFRKFALRGREPVGIDWMAQAGNLFQLAAAQLKEILFKL